MPFNYIDAIRGPQQALFERFGRPYTYRLGLDGVEATIKMFLRGLTEEDLFAGALQQDQVAIFNADTWDRAFPSRTSPQRLDRVITPKGQYSVEQWRGAPNDGVPIYYKVLLRGGSQ